MLILHVPGARCASGLACGRGARADLQPNVVLLLDLRRAAHPPSFHTNERGEMGFPACARTALPSSRSEFRTIPYAFIFNFHTIPFTPDHVVVACEHDAVASVCDRPKRVPTPRRLRFAGRCGRGAPPRQGPADAGAWAAGRSRPAAVADGTRLGCLNPGQWDLETLTLLAWKHSLGLLSVLTRRLSWRLRPPAMRMILPPRPALPCLSSARCATGRGHGLRSRAHGCTEPLQRHGHCAHAGTGCRQEPPAVAPRLMGSRGALRARFPCMRRKKRLAVLLQVLLGFIFQYNKIKFLARKVNQNHQMFITWDEGSYSLPRDAHNAVNNIKI